MIKIPDSFLSPNEHYIVIPALRRFCRQNKLKTSSPRPNLLENIIDFANSNEEQESIVLNWLESILKEGKKHLYVAKLIDEPNIRNLKNIKTSKNILETKFSSCPMEYLCTCKSTENLKLQSYEFNEADNGTISNISFYFTRIILEKSDSDTTGNRIIYPIFVDIDLHNNYIIGRAKSKTGIYLCTDTNTLLPKNKCKTSDLIKDAIDMVSNTLNISLENTSRSSSIFKNTLYNMLNEFTKTPDIIQNKIDSENKILENFIDDIFTRNNLSLPRFKETAKHDLQIWLEKFISIDYPDNKIFTKNRKAYPVKLTSTDSERTTIEEISANFEPLQCKEKFFDNKKSIEREKTCDGQVFCYNRINTSYFGKDPFIVKLNVEKNYLVVELQKYVEEEDIQDVLSTIIRNREL